MPVIKLGDLTTFTGSASGSWLVMNDPTNTTTYKVERETLLADITSVDTGSFATTGSNYFDGTQTVNGNLFMSGTFRLVYNNDSYTNMLFGMFDGSTIHGPYYQLFGNQYANLSQRGGAEFVYDIRNNPDANFHIASFNGSSWTQKFLVNDFGVQVTGSLEISGSAYINSASVVSSNTVQKIETITSASYAALNPPVSGTLYIIID